jgi:hypothetical protein
MAAAPFFSSTPSTWPTSFQTICVMVAGSSTSTWCRISCSGLPLSSQGCALLPSRAGPNGRQARRGLSRLASVRSSCQRWPSTQQCTHCHRLDSARVHRSRRVRHPHVARGRPAREDQSRRTGRAPARGADEARPPRRGCSHIRQPLAVLRTQTGRGGSAFAVRAGGVAA